MYVGDALMTRAAGAAMGAAAPGVRGTDMYYAPGFEKEFRQFVKSSGMTNITYTPKAAAAFDAAVALMDAFRRAPAPKDGPQLLGELYSVKFAGKSGQIAFDSSGDLKYDPATAYDVGEFQPDGKIKLVARGAAGDGDGAPAAAAKAGPAAKPAAAAGGRRRAAA